VFEKCLAEYNKIFSTGKTCAAFQALIYCLREEAVTLSCNAPIMDRFIRAANTIGQKADLEMNREDPEGCGPLLAV